MATAQMGEVIRHVRRVVLRQHAADSTDGQLLAAFIDGKDEAAFEALVRRHGPMVLSTCRRIVGNHHDAEDAFQATFLVLARKAPSVRPTHMVANWLHGVALRTSMKAKTTSAKRRGREKQVTVMPEPEAVQQDAWRELQPLIDRELHGLPENYRLPILLCDLEGKTIKEAAQQLGWPQGTLAGRLARGRQLLAKRLANRGVALSAGTVAVVLAQDVAAANVPTALMSVTVKAATMIAAGQATATEVVPAQVAALTEGVLKSMMLTKLSKAAVSGLVMLCLCGLVVGGFQASSAQETKTTITTTTTTTTITKQGKTDPLLEGVWEITWSESNGTLIPPEGDTITFIDGKFVITHPKSEPGSLTERGTFKTVIDPKGLRSDFDQTFTDGPHKGKTYFHSHRVEGDKLHLVGIWDAQFRPMIFSGRAGSRTSYSIWKRVTPQNTAKRTKATEAAEEEHELKGTQDVLQGTWIYKGRAWQGDVTEELLRKNLEEWLGRLTFADGECAWEREIDKDTSQVTRLKYTLETKDGGTWIVWQLKNLDPRTPPIPRSALMQRYTIQGDKMTFSTVVHPVKKHPDDPEPAVRPDDPAVVFLRAYFERQALAAKAGK